MGCMATASSNQLAAAAAAADGRAPAAFRDSPQPHLSAACMHRPRRSAVLGCTPAAVWGSRVIAVGIVGDAWVRGSRHSLDKEHAMGLACRRAGSPAARRQRRRRCMPELSGMTRPPGQHNYRYSAGFWYSK